MTTIEFLNSHPYIEGHLYFAIYKITNLNTDEVYISNLDITFAVQNNIIHDKYKILNNRFENIINCYNYAYELEKILKKNENITLDSYDQNDGKSYNMLRNQFWTYENKMNEEQSKCLYEYINDKYYYDNENNFYINRFATKIPAIKFNIKHFNINHFDIDIIAYITLKNDAYNKQYTIFKHMSKYLNEYDKELWINKVDPIEVYNKYEKEYNDYKNNIIKASKIKDVQFSKNWSNKLNREFEKKILKLKTYV